jgi:hypothetical protein
MRRRSDGILVVLNFHDPAGDVELLESFRIPVPLDEFRLQCLQSRNLRLRRTTVDPERV